MSSGSRHSFANVSPNLLLSRAFIPAMVILFFAIALMGSQVPHQPGRSALPSAIDHYIGLYDLAFNVPMICQDYAATEGHEREQCDIYGAKLMRKAAQGAIPVGVALIAVLLLYGLIRGAYRSASRAVTQKRVDYLGTVTSPAELDNDFRGWLLCMKPICVEDAGRNQRRVYMAIDAPTPLPGAKVGVYRVWLPLAGTRWVAVLHAPHMAIVG